MTICAIALGSNLGDRHAHLAFAAAELRKFLSNFTLSSVIETEPVGVPEPQDAFLNAAAVGETDLDASTVMRALLAIEGLRGRERPHPGAARTLDLDLILFGDAIIEQPALVVPHPRLRERRFVLEPLAEIAPELRDPVSGCTVRDLLDRLGGSPPPRF